MKRSKRRLPIPQFEFGFTAETFTLFSETTLDGWRIAREHDEAAEAKTHAEKQQTDFLAPKLKPVAKRHSFRLQEGDVIRYGGKDCPVLRVNECAAVIAVSREPRAFTTRFDKQVTIQPKPLLVRISPQSEVLILNR